MLANNFEDIFENAIFSLQAIHEKPRYEFCNI